MKQEHLWLYQEQWRTIQISIKNKLFSNLDIDRKDSLFDIDEKSKSINLNSSGIENFEKSALKSNKMIRKSFCSRKY